MYDVIECFSLVELISIVNKKIEEGWQPLGGIAILPAPDQRGREMYYQSLFKPETKS